MTEYAEDSVTDAALQLLELSGATIRVLITDDHTLFWEGMRALLLATPA